jgi:putative membrane protein
MKKIICTLALSAFFYTLSAQDQNKDHKFVTEAAEGGLMEVKLGELAIKNAKRDKVKALGQYMVTDHTKANNALKAIAASKGISLPAALGKNGQKEYDKLSGKMGDDFDKAYTDLMVKDHKKDIELFKKESEKGEDREFKDFATKTLPTLEHHLHMAKEACDDVKGK